MGVKSTPGVGVQELAQKCEELSLEWTKNFLGRVATQEHMDNVGAVMTVLDKAVTKIILSISRGEPVLAAMLFDMFADSMSGAAEMIRDGEPICDTGHGVDLNKPN